MDATFGEAFFTLIGIGILVSLLPIFIAFWRGHPNRWIIFIVAVVFGATILGWLIALVWSLHGFHRDKRTSSRGGASGLKLIADDVQLVRTVGQPIEPPMRDVVPETCLYPTLTRSQIERHGDPATIAEAAELLERLKSLRSRGHLDEHDAVRLKAYIIERM